MNSTEKIYSAKRLGETWWLRNNGSERDDLALKTLAENWISAAAVFFNQQHEKQDVK